MYERTDYGVGNLIRDVKEIDGKKYIAMDDALKAAYHLRAQCVGDWNFFALRHHRCFQTIIAKVWGGHIEWVAPNTYKCTDNEYTQYLIEKWQRLRDLASARILIWFDGLGTEDRSKLMDWIADNPMELIRWY